MLDRPRILALLALATLTACALNPATGKRQLSFIGEDQEVDMGREADPTIRRTFGTYDDEELQAYVERVGQKLAAVSERPELDWHFHVLDEGLTDYALVLSMLRDAQYDGFLTIECLSPSAQTQPVRTAQKDLQILRRFLKHVGWDAPLGGVR